MRINRRHFMSLIAPLLVSTRHAFAQASAGDADLSLALLPDDYSIDASREKLFRDYVVASALRDDASSGIVTSLPLPPTFNFPDDATYDRIAKANRPPCQFIVDLSHYSGPDIDFSTLKVQSIAGCYVKATQGVAFKDGLFAPYYSELSKLESGDMIRKGAYGFLTANDDPTAQANLFVDFVNKHGGFKGDLPPCVDLEWDRTSSSRDRWVGHAPSSIIQSANTWLKIVEQRTKRQPIIYTAKSFLAEHGIESAFSSTFSDYRLWIADYSRSHKAVEKPAVPSGMKPTLWQFASDATLSAGYDKRLDASIFYGSPDDFAKAFA